ncbi:sensitivity to high expression protein she9 [Monascus purpureus]|uniref:Sensitive to high expression protein 9, mitochondrial n=1 Tax=Monascus purpureus TaxID=5098 RepID=A0A507R615_MONPU|nr:sensitivity to high expression protein she9 [Monascus purpureus]
MPLFLRQSLRSSISIARTSSHPGRAQFPLSAAVPKAHIYHREQTQSFSICRQCQFRLHPTLLHEVDKDRPKDGSVGNVKISESGPDPSLTTSVSEGGPRPQELDIYSQQSLHTSDEGGVEGVQKPDTDTNVRSQRISRSSAEVGKDGAKKNDWSDFSIGNGRLPSYLESRRSQFAKKFSSMMDDLQSNIFVAGQHLNDLTGYSSIEALKKQIHEQEQRARDSRQRVREAKEAYTDAINRRSASQREVNELLQRKHNWSATDLERFTSLYRNDHANEVAEAEAQEALTRAEQEAEEAAAQLSKAILSRYHEEQVWSDKIRRMSTWGTWGLMGVNVLLFLIFQVAVEPWRRRRLVTGFEEKVIEAIEREKAMHQIPESPKKITPDEADTVVEEVPIITEDDEPIISNVIVDDTELFEKKQQPRLPTPTTSDNRIYNFLETCKSRLSEFRHPSAVETSIDYLQDCFSDHTIVISKRDITNVAMQSAVLGATVTGLLIVFMRSW